MAQSSVQVSGLQNRPFGTSPGTRDHGAVNSAPNNPACTQKSTPAAVKQPASLALCGHDVEANLAKAQGLPVSSFHRCKLTWFRAELQEREGNYSEAFLTMVGLALTYLELQQNLNACWAACEAARLSRLAPVDMGKLADIISRSSFALPDDSRAASALARLWVAMTSPGKKQKLLPLMVAVREAVKRERLAAARAL